MKKSPKITEKSKAPLGSGERFKKLEKELAKKGVKDPGALAAAIGRNKYGNERMEKLAQKGMADSKKGKK